MWNICLRDKPFFIDMCRTLLAELPASQQKLQQALGCGDMAAAKRAAHTLKGVALQTQMPFAQDAVLLDTRLKDAVSLKTTEGQRQIHTIAATAGGELEELQRLGGVLARQVATALEDARMVLIRR